MAVIDNLRRRTNNNDDDPSSDIYDRRYSRMVNSAPAHTDPDTLERCEDAIQAAVSAANDLGVKPHEGHITDEDEDFSTHRESFTLDLEGLENAVHAGQIERRICEIPGVEARVVIGDKQTAWISAPSTVAPSSIIDLLAEECITAEKKVGTVYRWISESESESSMVKNRRRRARRGQQMFENRPTFKVQRPDNMEVLYTARELVTRTRLWVSLVLTIPVVVMSLVPAAQITWWQWISAALATPVVIYGAWPFHRAAIGGLRRGLAALDAATSLAIALAYVWSLAIIFFVAGGSNWHSEPHWLHFQHQPQIFLDVACSATTLVLFGRLLSRYTRLYGMRLVTSHDVDSGHPVTVIRKSAGEVVKKVVKVTEVHPGEDILVGPGDLIPVDGTIIGGASLITPGPVSGHIDRTVLKVNDKIFAGGRNMGDTLKIRVDRTGHTTRLAAMHRWVEECEQAEDASTRVATKSASVLVPWTIVLAVFSFLIWFLITEDASGSVAVALSVLAGVGPFSLAISTTMASRLGLARATSRGILFRDEQAIWNLAHCNLILFNRVGALTKGQMRVESVTAADGENADLVLRVAGALAMESDHAVSRALVKAARESRDQGLGGDSVPHWIDVSGGHVTCGGSFVATVEIPLGGEMASVKASLWRPRDLSELEDERLARAAISGGTPLVVSWKNKNRGVITVLDATKDDAADSIEQLEDLGIETGMLSRDTYPVAKRAADALGMSTVLAGISPDRKAAAVRSMHRQGYSVGLVGDPDLMDCLTVADVGMLVGAADCLDEADASVVVLRDEVRAIPDAVNLASRVRRIGRGNMLFSWGYHIVALTGAALALINPLLSTALMLLCTWIIEFRTMRLRRA